MVPRAFYTRFILRTSSPRNRRSPEARGDSRTRRRSGRGLMASPSDAGPAPPSPRSVDGQQTQQYKSFVAWINHHLRTRGIATVVTNLEDALEDGLLLIDLIEHLSGQKLATPVRKPTLRVQKLNNLAIAFKQLKREIHMENIAPEDIADRNVKIVMGLVWSLILRYQIASLEGSIKSGALDEEQRQTLIDYVGRYLRAENVTVQSFEQSFSDGMAFCALFKLLKPDLINMSAVQKDAPRARLKQAFALWEQHFAVPQFLDAEELVSRTKADERSVMTYVALCLSILERNHVPCAPAEGRKIAQSGKNKFMFMSSALMPKTKAIDGMDLSSSTLTLDFSGKRLQGASPRDLDASLRNNPLLSPRHHGQASPRPSQQMPSPRSARFRVPAIDARGAGAQSPVDSTRQVQTARSVLQSSGSAKDVFAKSEAAKLHEELDTQISKLASIVGSATATTAPAPASPAPAASPAPSAVSVADGGAAPPLAKASSTLALSSALEQIESITLTLAPKSKPEATAHVTTSPAASGTNLVDPKAPPPPVPRPANYTPSQAASAAATAATAASAPVPAPSTAVAATAAPATVPATAAPAAATTGTKKDRGFLLMSAAEFAQLVSSSTTAVSTAAKTFIGDVRGKSGAAELRQVTSLRPLIVVVVRETGGLLAAMAEGRESRELIAGVKSFIISGYQLTAALAREGDPAALKDALQTLVCQIKLLLRNLAWLGEA